MKYCIKPFTSIEVDTHGDVYTCCPAFLRNNVDGTNNRIGNILENSFDEIWYSDKAIELRKKVMNGDYSMCDLDLCRQRELRFEHEFSLSSKPEAPIDITLAYDKECNFYCITCRDEKYKNSTEMKELLNSRIKDTLMPLLKNAKKVAMSGSGELFASEHSRLLVKEITSNYPYIKFLIMTNGLLCNKTNCDALGLGKNIHEIFVSLPAISKKIYNSIIRGGNIDIVTKNIKWLAQSQKEGLIGAVKLSCVVSSLNYREIPNLVNFAKKLGITIIISQYYSWGTKLGEDYENLAVWNYEHKKHKDFVKILKKYTNYDECFLQPLFQELKDN